jgi:lysophospholipase L1-like esterase
VGGNQDIGGNEGGGNEGGGNQGGDEKPIELKNTNVYLVGDSTVCSFNDSYYYPRYGYGTQLGNYLNNLVTIHNLALSGRSSKSFTAEENYQTLLSSLKEGDYLIIGFGHNDEKSDDDLRFTDASKPTTDSSSFKYSLYENYIKVAIEKKATPILCTPIVRANSKNDYSGANAHITENGDYAKAIIELGLEKNVPVINLTEITKNQYVKLGYNEAIYYHAMTAGKYDTDGVAVIPDTTSVDTTHLNIYGAKYVAYKLAEGLKNSECALGKYVLDNIKEPTKADLVSIEGYVVPSYTAPVLENYVAPEHFATISEGWYGTAFGDCGGTPTSSSNGFLATEYTEGVFTVGQYKEGSNKGKLG